MRLLANIAFGGDLPQLNVDAAAEALRKAGYDVHRAPEKYRERYDHPLDDFIEAYIEGDDESAVMDEINALVEAYGGLCHECGSVEPDQAPLSEGSDGDRSSLLRLRSADVVRCQDGWSDRLAVPRASAGGLRPGEGGAAAQTVAPSDSSARPMPRLRWLGDLGAAAVLVPRDEAARPGRAGAVDGVSQMRSL
jgi:hypothetical protein